MKSTRGDEYYLTITESKKRFADNGKEALDQILTWQPDMVLLDWHMPEMTGIELLNKVKELNIKTKIGLITAEKNQQSKILQKFMIFLRKTLDQV